MWRLPFDALYRAHIAVLFAIFQYNTVLVAATYLLFCLYTITKKSEVAELFFTLTGGLKTLFG